MCVLSWLHISGLVLVGVADYTQVLERARIQTSSENDNMVPGSSFHSGKYNLHQQGPLHSWLSWWAVGAESWYPLARDSVVALSAAFPTHHVISNIARKSIGVSEGSLHIFNLLHKDIPKIKI